MAGVVDQFATLSRRVYATLKQGESIKSFDLSRDTIRVLETAWGLPKTGTVGELEYNFPAHHLTSLSSKYYSNPIYKLILAIRDGETEVAMGLLKDTETGNQLWRRLYEGEYLSNGMKFGPSYEILDYVVTRLELMVQSQCNGVSVETTVSSQDLDDKSKAWADMAADVMAQYFEVAVAKRDIEKIKSLFDRGYDAEFFAIREGCRQGDLEMLKALDSHFGLDRNSILYNAFFYGRQHIIRHFWNISHESRKTEYLQSAVRGGRLDAVLLAQDFLKISINLDMCYHVATKNVTLDLLQYFERKFGDAFLATMAGESLWSTVACSRDKDVVLYAISKGFRDWLDPVEHNLLNSVYYDPSLIMLLLADEDDLDKGRIIELARRQYKTVAARLAIE